MSKRAYISRYLLIIKKLKAKPYATYEELKQYIETQLEYLQVQDEELNMGFSKRTFQRDLKEIRNLFGLDIEYSSRNKGYHILQTERESMNFQRMLEAFDVFNSLNMAQDVSQYIHIERRKPQGTEHLHGLLHAIKNRLHIKFTYQKFEEDEISHRELQPYALKEFKSRWYVYGKDCKDNNIKTFALDRLSDLEISNKKFELDALANVEEKFRYFFGIITPENEEPQEIILSFTPLQGKYIKTLPLHHTQKIIVDNDEELRISLKLCATYDFLMELLSYGEEVTVLQHASLAEKIKAMHEDAVKNY